LEDKALLVYNGVYNIGLREERGEILQMYLPQTDGRGITWSWQALKMR
jgi:hypothetical protein